MKKTLLLLAALAASFGANAQIIGDSQARQFADSFFNLPQDSQTMKAAGRDGSSDSDSSISLAFMGGEGDAPAFYVFNRGEGQGFVIVSGDERTVSPILGYSDHGTFNAENLSENLKSWLDGYAGQIESVRRNGTSTVQPQRAPAMGTPVVSPLISTHWDQDEPYNTKTPKVSGKHAPVGCVAVAVAQIMNYHRWPERGTGYLEYEWSSSYLERDFSECTYDWNDLDVPQLMSDVGIACKTNYKADESGAYDLDAGRAMVRYFGYDKGMEIHFRKYPVDWDIEAWHRMLREELDASRPVFYSGSHRSGRTTIAHAFICDGYDSNGYFHFNFGWGGSDDGWFLAEATGNTVDDYEGVVEFTSDQVVITHIQKDNGGSAWVGTAKPGYEYVWALAGDTLERTFSYEDSKTGTMYYDETSELALPANNVYGGEFSNTSGCGPLTDLPDGTYRKRAVFRVKGYDKWYPFDFYYGKTSSKLREEFLWVDVADGKRKDSPSLSFKTGEFTYTRINDTEVELSDCYYAKSDQEVVIPDTVSYRDQDYRVVGVSCGNWCPAFISLTLPEGLRYIEELKFDGILKNIPSSVERIGDLMVKNSSVSLPEGITGIDRITCGNTSFTIPESVKRIGRLDGEHLTSLVIPASLEEVGEYFLSENTALKTVTFETGSRLKSLPQYCFSKCKRLQSLRLPESVETIGDRCFSECGSLKNIEIPSNVREMGYGVFNSCVNLEHVEFPDDSRLETIGAGTGSYEGGSFDLCENLEYISFPSSLKVLNGRFTGCGIVYADFSRTSITELGMSGLFYNCHGLETVLLPPTLKKMGSIENCESLLSLVIPEGVEKVGLLKCENLSYVVIPSTIQTFADFDSYYGDMTVICSSPTPVQGGALVGRPELTVYVPAGAAQAYRDFTFMFRRVSYSITGQIIEMSSGEEQTNVTAQDDEATVLGSSTAQGAISLPSSIEDEYGNEVPVTAIADYAFMGNGQITSVDIPASIGSGAAVQALMRKTRSEAVEASSGIGECAFAYCMNLDTVYVHWTSPAAIDESVFRGIDLSGVTLIVPDGTVGAYSSAPIWKQFGTIIDETTAGVETKRGTDVPAVDGPLYDLLGRPVMGSPAPSFYIRDGRKLIVL